MSNTNMYLRRVLDIDFIGLNSLDVKLFCLPCSCLFRSSRHHSGFHRPACSPKNYRSSRTSIDNHLHSGFNHLYQCNQFRYRMLYLIYFSRKRYYKKQSWTIQFGWMFAGGVGITDMVEKLEDEEYMGFENLCKLSWVLSLSLFFSFCIFYFWLITDGILSREQAIALNF